MNSSISVFLSCSESTVNQHSQPQTRKWICFSAQKEVWVQHTHTRVRHMNNPIAGWLVKSLAVCRLCPWNLSLPAHKLSQKPGAACEASQQTPPTAPPHPKKHNYQLCLCLFTPLKLRRTRTKTPEMKQSGFLDSCRFVVCEIRISSVVEDENIELLRQGCTDDWGSEHTEVYVYILSWNINIKGDIKPRTCEEHKNRTPLLERQCFCSRCWKSTLRVKWVCFHGFCCYVCLSFLVRWKHFVQILATLATWKFPLHANKQTLPVRKVT